MDPMTTPARQPLAPASAATRPSLLGRDYWLVLSTPHPDTTVADIHRLADEHVAWLLKLAAIAATDPFVLAGLRSFEVFGWRLNEGAISIQLSLGTGSYTWT
jgi:hypothetical protein